MLPNSLMFFSFVFFFRNLTIAGKRTILVRLTSNLSVENHEWICITNFSKYFDILNYVTSQISNLLLIFYFI